MSFSSSPPVYPQSSSAPVVEKRKRTHLNEPPVQLKRRLVGLHGPKIVENGTYDTTLKGSATNVILDLDSKHAQSKQKGPFLEDDDNETINDTELLAVFQDNLDRPVITDSLGSKISREKPQKLVDSRSVDVQTAAGKSFSLRKKSSQANRLSNLSNPAKSNLSNTNKSFYGIDINSLIGKAVSEKAHTPRAMQVPGNNVPRPSIETTHLDKNRNERSMMWTEKYRAKKFTDLVGDERTHRQVLRWLKCWDPTVFPTSQRPQMKNKVKAETEETPIHRKILLLAGPPGLGKTTLAHVCARQAGYEVVEINASDERNRDVVRGRIRDCVGTENVKGVNVQSSSGTVRKAGRPVCVIVDEVDGVVGGSSGSGEGGFIKALIDLVTLDQRNSTPLGRSTGNVIPKRAKKGDRFRLLRPLILICNDVYHPTLRPLRSSTIAEIIHIRRPPLDRVVARLKAVFEKEGVVCDGDGVRRLCEAAWGISDRRESRLGSSCAGEGDIRGVLVVGEWVAAQLRVCASSQLKTSRLTKKWVEQHVLRGLSHGGDAARGLHRGGAKEALERVFLDGAGFPKSTSSEPGEVSLKNLAGQSLGVSEVRKRNTIARLQEVVDSCGEFDRIVADCFAMYPSQPIQDDIFLSKPNAAYEWLHFHDSLSSKVYSGQEWELSPYLSQTALSFHHLFASPSKHVWSGAQSRWEDDNEEEPTPFSGIRAEYEASEAQKSNKAILLTLQSSLSALLLRTFRSPQDLSEEFLPYLVRILVPEVKAVVMGGGGDGDQASVVNVRNGYEREVLKRAAILMSATGVSFERTRIEDRQVHGSNYVYRMEPPIDTLLNFDTASKNGSTTVSCKYALYQALDQEHRKYLVRQNSENRQARYDAGNPSTCNTADHARCSNLDIGEKILKPKSAKRDFFGRLIETRLAYTTTDVGFNSTKPSVGLKPSPTYEAKVWVSFHEGFSNAVRKPITLEDLMKWF